MSLPEAKLGIIPGAGGTQRLTRLVGMARAKELIYTGQRLNGEEAEKIGMSSCLSPYVMTGLEKKKTDSRSGEYHGASPRDSLGSSIDTFKADPYFWYAPAYCSDSSR